VAVFPFPELALVLAVLAALGYRAITREKREYGRFRRLRTTLARQRTYRRWLIEAIAVIGGLGILTTLGGWESIAPALESARSSPLLAGPLAFFATPTGTVTAVVIGGAFLALAIVPVLVLKAEREDVPVVGDIAALLPRTRGELPYGAGLALNAGVSEELLFRLGLPALLFAVLGDGVLAFAVAGVVFGLLHVYQGPVGVLATTVLGLLLAAVYVLSGSIWLPIAIHALIDLRSLVLLPIRFGVLRLDELPRPAPRLRAQPAASASDAAEEPPVA